MKYGKTELIRRISDIVRNGWNNNAIRDLVESLWRDPYSMRTSGFVREGGTDAVMSVQVNMTLIDDVPYYGITFTIGPKVKKFDFYQFREILTYHKKYWAESITFEALEGLHAVYYDFDPQTYEQVLMHHHNPTYDQLSELLQWLVPVTFLYYDANAHQIIYWGDNRHGSWWNPWMHDVLHKTMNSMRESGLEFSDITADGDGSMDNHAQFGISAGSCFHGDMRKESLGVSAPADLPVFYFIAGDLPRIHETSVDSLVVDGLLCYNQNGAAVPATDGWFVMVHVFFTNCLYHPFIAVIGQSQYEKVSTASYMVNSEVTLVRERLPHQNLLHVGTLILQTSAAFSNSYHSRIVTHAYGVKTDLSVTGDGSLVKPVVLLNDQDLPGPEKYYGTNSEGIKGYHALPAGGGGSMTPDKDFEFCISPGYPEVFKVDIYALEAYSITRAVLETDAGILEGVQVKIDGVVVAGLDDMDVTTSPALFTASGNNLVWQGSVVTIHTSGVDSGMPAMLRGKIACTV